MPPIIGIPVTPDSDYYALEDARTALKRIAPWLTQEVNQEPLLGLYDGVNAIFHVPYTPIDSSAGIQVYDAGGNPVTSYTVLSYDAGTLRFSAGSLPTATLYASYTAQAISDDKLLNICHAGFLDMEARYRRDLAIVRVGGRHYISAQRASLQDPICGERTFNTSPVQQEFLHACCEYVLIKTLQTDAALRNFAYREERVGGLLVDRSRQADAFNELLALADRKATEKMAAARYECGDFAEFGNFVTAESE